MCIVSQSRIQSLLFTVLLFTALLFSPLISHAVDDEAALHAAAMKAEWLHLLHYEKNKHGVFTLRSMVDDNAFFISPQGATDPLAELKATLQLTVEEQCRFPARLDWLNRHFKTLNFRFEHCHEYKKWRSDVNGHSVSLIFPSAYLNSPSSMFGHTLLRIDPKHTEDHSLWLSWGVNFGANVNTNDNSIFYVYRGLAGGYPGQFNMVPYFEKIKDYSRRENRDMWEYRLNLSEAEVDRLLMHLWELRDVNFDYYFLDENCSYRLLELLEVARPGSKLTHAFTWTAIPASTVKTLHTHGFVDHRNYRPSKARQLTHWVNQLTPEQRDLAKRYANASAEADSIDEKQMKSLSHHEQSLVLNTAYQYLRYQNDLKERDPEIAKRSFELLRQINTLPKITITPPPAPTPPEEGHETRLLSMALGYDKREHIEQEYMELRYRATYHDLLDDTHGYLQGAQIELGHFAFRYTSQSHVQLQEATLLNILSATPQNDFIKPLAWTVYLGSERFPFAMEKLSTHLSAGIGRSISTGDQSYGYWLALGSAEHNDGHQRNLDVALGWKAGWHGSLMDGLGHIKLHAQQRFFYDDRQRHQLGITYQHQLERNLALRLHLDQHWQRGKEVEHEDATDLRLELRHYF